MKALIIEDEANAANRLEKYIAEVDPEIQILAILDGIESTIKWWRDNNRPDMIFMDVHLSDGICFEIFDQINLDKPIIFTTAYDEYALKSFNHHAIDYILKPIKKPDLERALNKMKTYIQGHADLEGRAEVSEDIGGSGLRRLLVKIGPKINLIRMKDVAYFYSKDKITFAMTAEGRRFPVDKSLEYLENNLDDSFFRINRQFIIHINAISGMLSHTKGRVKIKLQPEHDSEIVVSTDRSPHFKKWLVQ